MESTKKPQHSVTRILGLELSGPTSKKTRVVALDYFTQSKRLVLSRLLHAADYDDKKNDKKHADAQLINNIARLCDETPLSGRCYGIFTQAPTQLPPLFKNSQQCQIEEAYMSQHNQGPPQRKRVYSSYLNRPLEVWMRNSTPEKFLISETLGANMAPLAARMQYLLPRLKLSVFENNPAATLQRIVFSMGLKKTLAQHYSDFEDGLENRHNILNQIIEKNPQIFIYDHDVESLTVDLASFNAFVSSLSGFLHLKDKCEKIERSFPKESTWPVLPKQSFRFADLFEENTP